MTDYDPGFNPQNYNTQAYQVNNQGFNSATALGIRLDFQTPLENFQMYLRGVAYVTVAGDKGQPVTKEVKIGDPIVNKRGYQAVMHWHSIVNAQVVQGNFVDDKELGFFMMHHRIGFFSDMMLNRKEYGIDIKQIRALSDRYCDFVYPVLTRCLFNKEREGMNNTVKVQETVNSQTRGSGWSLIPMFGGKKQ